MHRTEQSTSLTEDKLHVFVFPTSLNFYSDDTSSYQAAMTLYNPYDFNIKYKVLCTAPKKYKVVDSEGTVTARCCVDIIIRHRDISLRNENVKDKFRIQIAKYGEKTVIGKKDVPALLLPTRDRTQSTEEAFESLVPPASLAQETMRGSSSSRPFTSVESSRPSWIIIATAIVCVAALMLPSEVIKDSSIPYFLCITNNQKMIAAYVLGLVTMVIFRS